MTDLDDKLDEITSQRRSIDDSMREFERDSRRFDADSRERRARALDAEDSREQRLADKRTVRGEALATARSVPKGALEAAGGTLRGQAINLLPSDTVRDSRAYRAGERLSELAESEALHVPEEYQGRLSTDVGSGAGSMGFYMVGGGAGGVLGRGAARAAGRSGEGVARGERAGQLGAAVGSAAPAGADQAYQRALQFGFDDEQAQAISREGNIWGAVQVANINFLLRPFPRDVRDRVMGEIGPRIGWGGASEATVEGLGALGQNKIEMAYNPETGLFDNVGYSALIGGLSAAGIQGARAGVAQMAPEREGTEEDLLDRSEIEALEEVQNEVARKPKEEQVQSLTQRLRSLLGPRDEAAMETFEDPDLAADTPDTTAQAAQPVEPDVEAPTPPDAQTPAADDSVSVEADPVTVEAGRTETPMPQSEAVETSPEPQAEPLGTAPVPAPEAPPLGTAPATPPDPAPLQQGQSTSADAAAPPQPIRQARGGEARVRTARGNDVPAHFAVVEASDLIASHDADGRTDPRFPEDMQPRDRSRQASRRQVSEMSRAIRPEELGDTGRADTGAPVIGPDGVVESGNARSAALQEAYRRGRGEDYRQWVQQQAEAQGIPADQVQGVEQPVLVRVRDQEMSPDERRQFARDANVSDLAPMAASEQAQADADAITDDMMSQFRPDESGNVLAASNNDFLRNFAQAIGDLQAGGMATADGRWTKQMADRVQAAVFARAYGDPRLVELMAEEADPGVKNILNALQQAAPAFARARAIDPTLGSMNVVAPIVDGVHLIIDARNRGQSVDQMVNQASMFDAPDPQATSMALFMASNNRSARRMGEGFRAMGEMIETELRNAQNEALFPDQYGATMNDVVGAANRYLEERYGQETAIRPQPGDLFTTPAQPAASEQPAAESGGRERDARAGRDRREPDREQGARADDAETAVRPPAEAEPDQQAETPAEAGVSRSGAGETITSPRGETFVNTRGGNLRFHGTSSPIEALDDASWSSQNVFGQGFYTTDAADIADGYMRKGRGERPTLYRVERQAEAALYDIEQPMAAEVEAVARRALGEDFPTEVEGGRTPETLRQVLEAYADQNADIMSVDEIQQGYDAIQRALMEKGYDGYAHTGNQGDRAHSVEIYWRPSAHISITQDSIDSYRAEQTDLTPGERPDADASPVETGQAEAPDPGSPGSPATVETSADIDQAAQRVETDPSAEQIEAGNYRKAHVSLQGLNITIENPKGSVRRGTDPDGNQWETELAHHYGYIKATEGADGDHVDVFIGPDTESDRVFIIDQVNADGSFDEHKVMLGFRNQKAARDGYRANYQDGWKVGPTTRMSMDEFHQWLADGKTAQPVSERSNVPAHQGAGTPLKDLIPLELRSNFPSYLLQGVQGKGTAVAGQHPFHGVDGVRKAIERARSEDTASHGYQPYVRLYDNSDAVGTIEFFVSDMKGSEETMKSLNGQLFSSSPTSATATQLRDAWVRLNQKQNSIKRLQKEYPEAWEKYRKRQQQVIKLKKGDRVTTGNVSAEHPFGIPGTIVRRGQKNFRVQPDTGAESELMPIETLAPEGAVEADAPGTVAEASKPAAKKRAKAKADQQIEDFGEKLEGARKDYAAKMEAAKEKNPIEAPLSELWPIPDHQKLLDSGADPVAVGFVRAARESLPPKPRRRGLKSWIRQLESSRDVAEAMLEGRLDIEQARQFSASNQGSFPESIFNVAELYAEVGHSQSLKGIRMFSATFSMWEGETGVFDKWIIEHNAKKSPFSNMPRRIADGDTKAEVIEKFKAVHKDLEQKPTSKHVRFDIYSNRYDRSDVFIAKKIGSDVVRIKSGFSTAREARKYLAENQQELERLLEARKNIPNHRKDENAARLGTDHRQGADATPELFGETFGFRGVQFGNYVEQGRRQQDLNDAFDGLMDLAAIINVPPRALSLNGELGLAFGARGKGGKRSAKAHYESDTVVINLTKRRGAGSLAHEWFHALDNYFGRGPEVSRSSQFATSRAGKGVRPEVADAFRQLVQTVNETAIRERSLRLDEVRSNAYWSTDTEMTARAFESYVIEKLKDQGQANDYLANIVSQDYWEAQEALGQQDSESYPYPQAAEIPEIRAAYDRLFETIETRETDQGVALFSLGSSDQNQATARDPKFTLRSAVATTDRITRGWRGAPPVRVVADTQSNIVPRELRQIIERDGLQEQARGVFWRGEVYAFHNNLQSRRELEEVILHEVIGHYGLRQLLGDSMNPVLNQVWMAYGGRKRARALIETYFPDGFNPNNRTQRHIIAEELLAHVAQTGQHQRWWSRLAALAQDKLRQLGFEIRPNEVDLHRLLRKAHEVVENGGLDLKASFVGRDEGGPRFSKTPAQQNQQKLWKAIASQPVDRLFRAVFDATGTLDSRGRLKKGVELTEGVKHALTEWTPNEKGRFAWMNDAIEVARHGLIDKYGLEKSYRMKFREAEAHERKLLMDAMDILKSLESRNVGKEEARVLQAVLTGEAIPEGEWGKLAAPIRRAIDDLGLEAVEYGIITREAYERNRGTYLHRTYRRHEEQASPLSRWATNLGRKRRRKIHGDAAKRRGMDWKVPTQKLMQHIPVGWYGIKREGQRPDMKALHGQEFVILQNPGVRHEATDQFSAMPEEGGRRQQVVDTVYWPADRAIPARFDGWNNRGQWRIRQAQGNTVVLHRDYTKAERENMGEILDARYNIAKTFESLSRDLAMGKFFQDVSRNDEWFRSEEPNGVILSANEANSLLRLQKADWVKMPDSGIKGSSIAKSWGALSGGYVRPEIWRDLNELDKMHTPGTWRQVLTQWKLNKTARSPVVHMNNVMSNFLLMDMADVRATDFVRGLRSYRNRDDLWRQAQEHGAFEGTLITEEIRRKVLDPVLKDLAKESINESLSGRLALFSRMGYALHGKLKTMDRSLVDLYQLEDEIFRMATFMRRLDLGDTAADAALIAREQFLDYDIRAPWVNAARRTVLPFISYTYRAVPVVAESMIHRPWKLAKYITIAHLANTLAYELAPGDEDEERRTMRREAQGSTWVGTPRMIRMPWRDEHDNPVFMDVRRWIPAGDVFDMNQGQSAVPIPAPLQFGGPLMLGAELALNKQAFTGQPIRDRDTDTPGEAVRKVSDWAWKSWMPSAAWIPGGWYWDRIWTAAGGGRDMVGRPYSLPQAVVSSVGIKVQPHDVELGYYYRGRDLDFQRRSVQAQARQAQRDLSRGLITERQYEREVELIERKMGMLEQEYRALHGRTE